MSDMRRTQHDPYVDGDVGYVPLRNRAGDIVATAIVDAEDLSRVTTHRWAYGQQTGQVIRTVGKNGPSLTLGRAVLGLPPSGAPRIRHIDANPLNNRKGNLRVSAKWLHKQLMAGGSLPGVISRLAISDWHVATSSPNRTR